MDEIITLLRGAGANAGWILASLIVGGVWRALLRGDLTLRRDVERLQADLDETKADRTRWMEMAWRVQQTNSVAVGTAVKALSEHPAGEAPP